jgi:hypothetical protein
MGLDARILTRRWHGDRNLANGIPVVVAKDTESTTRRAAYACIEQLARPIEDGVMRWQAERYARAMGSETTYRPMVSPALADCFRNRESRGSSLRAAVDLWPGSVLIRIGDGL